MTDEAMNVAAEPAAAPEAVQTEAPAVEIDRASEPTARDAIERAFAEVDKVGNDTPVETKPDPIQLEQEQEEGQPRTPDGKFAPRTEAEQASKDKAETVAEKPEADEAKIEELTSFAEAPKRFSNDAKEAWKSAPEPVRAEITRAISELENGINQYREAYEPFKDFAQRVSDQGGNPGEALNSFVNLENQIFQNPVQGLDIVIGNMHQAGLLKVGTLNELVSVMSGQEPDQRQVMQDQTIRDLRNEIHTLKQELGGVTTSIKSQSEQATMKEIEAFASQPEHGRFEELSPDIALFLQNGRANNLQEAYDLAERLNPAPQAPAPAQPAAPQAAQPAAPAQPRKGNLSITGAPSTGSNPANRKPASSARESLDNAFASVGL
jgi:hypothetical protein